jgi:hypothetical protein
MMKVNMSITHNTFYSQHELPSAGHPNLKTDRFRLRLLTIRKTCPGYVRAVLGRTLLAVRPTAIPLDGFPSGSRGSRGSLRASC